MSDIIETVTVRGGKLVLKASLPSEPHRADDLRAIFRAKAGKYESPSDRRTIEVEIGQQFETLSALHVEFLPFKGIGGFPA